MPGDKIIVAGFCQQRKAPKAAANCPEHVHNFQSRVVRPRTRRFRPALGCGAALRRGRRRRSHWRAARGARAAPWRRCPARARAADAPRPIAIAPAFVVADRRGACSRQASVLSLSRAAPQERAEWGTDRCVGDQAPAGSTAWRAALHGSQASDQRAPAAVRPRRCCAQMFGIVRRARPGPTARRGRHSWPTRAGAIGSVAAISPPCEGNCAMLAHLKSKELVRQSWIAPP
jgi:hypothetical protein